MYNKNVFVRTYRFRQFAALREVLSALIFNLSSIRAQRNNLFVKCIILSESNACFVTQTFAGYARTGARAIRCVHIYVYIDTCVCVRVRAFYANVRDQSRDMDCRARVYPNLEIRYIPSS